MIIWYSQIIKIDQCTLKTRNALTTVENSSSSSSSIGPTLSLWRGKFRFYSNITNWNWQVAPNVQIYDFIFMCKFARLNINKRIQYNSIGILFWATVILNITNCMSYEIRNSLFRLHPRKTPLHHRRREPPPELAEWRRREPPPESRFPDKWIPMWKKSSQNIQCWRTWKGCPRSPLLWIWASFSLHKTRIN